MPTTAEIHFHEDMIHGSEILKREIHYNPIRFNQMVAEYGGVEAAHRLLAPGSNTSDGFTTLFEHNRLERSVEAWALLPWYEHLFSTDELERARFRLTEHRFDVDLFIADARLRIPQWVKAQESA
jgi:hypothetical protein